MTAPRTVKVLVVDDHAGIRNALARLIDSEQPQLWCVGSAATGAEALTMARKKQPDVILLDVVLGDEDGLALIAPLHRSADVAIVVLTSLVDPRVAARAQRLGASNASTSRRRRPVCSSASPVRVRNSRCLRPLPLERRGSFLVRRQEQAPSRGTHFFRCAAERGLLK